MIKLTRQIFRAIAAASKFPDRMALLNRVSELRRTEAIAVLQLAVDPDDFMAKTEEAKREASEIAGSWRYGMRSDYKKTLTVTLDGEHYGYLPEWFEPKVEAADDVNLHIVRGGGGIIEEALGAVGIMSKSRKWRSAYVEQHAYSASAILFVSAPRRIMHPEAKLMFHRPSVVTFADAVTLRAQADYLDATQEKISELFGVLGVSKETVAALFRPGFDSFLTAEQAKGLGLCDEISDCR